jgi:hypothetical protein
VNSAASSSGSTTCFCARMPCFNGFRADPALPSSVLGPRDLAPFLRLASARAWLTGTAARSAAVALDMTGFLERETGAGWASARLRTASPQPTILADHRNIVERPPCQYQCTRPGVARLTQQDRSLQASRHA